MATPTYVVKKIGDQYVTVRKDETSGPASLGCAGLAASGGAMLLYGLWRGGLAGAGLAVTGGALMYRGLTGINPLHLISGCCGRSAHGPSGEPEDTPSYHNDFRRRAPQMPADPVDEASMESFPASDPPAHVRTASTPAAMAR